MRTKWTKSSMKRPKSKNMDLRPLDFFHVFKLLVACWAVIHICLEKALAPAKTAPMMATLLLTKSDMTRRKSKKNEKSHEQLDQSYEQDEGEREDREEEGQLDGEDGWRGVRQ